MKTHIATMILVVFGGITGEMFGSAPAVIPQPVVMKTNEGQFQITSKTPVVATGAFAVQSGQLLDTLEPAMGFRLKQFRGIPHDGAISLALDGALKTELGKEGYTLRVTARRIDLRAASPAGLFYGVQTLRQLLPAEVFSADQVDGVAWTVPCVEIKDYPRFGWRGLLIDPARHFISVPDVKRFIDTMVLHKFNHLQMHLTDNIAWRVEIKKYPDLTRLASQRDRSGGQGGFYTQRDIRELVRYAAERHVTIIPEIEMPFHAGAAINAYPQLGINPSRVANLSPDERWGKLGGLVAPRPKTVAFMQDVLREVIELFPSPFIHIGGDEANIKLWDNDPELQAVMKRLDCKDAHALHSWFIQQMDDFLTKQDRRLLGWDEILQGGLASGATVMSWRGESGGITAAKAGHDVVMAPTSHTYFDYYQGPPEKEPRAIGGHLPLETVYDYEPIPAALDADQARHVLGAQAQLWGEFIPTAKHHQYLTFPRSCALSEVVWSPKAGPEGRNFDLFLLRLSHHLTRLDAAKVNYRPLDRKPAQWQGKQDANAPQAARALLERLLPEHVDKFVFEVISPESGRDVFEIESRDGKVIIGGNTGVSMAMGLNWYLRYHCHCHVSWYGDQLDLPTSLPVIEKKVRRVTWAKHRYFLNYCCFGYSLPFWDWGQWQRLNDWMALNGVNMPLSVTGQEAVWQAVCERLGLSEQETEAYFAGPPFLPFQWMGCLDSWGGPLPADWIERHAELQKKILAQQRELGMTPVLQGFTGHVPAAIKQKFSEAKLHSIKWIEWNTHLLDPLDPLFAKISAMWIEEQTRLFGTDHYYAVDTFIEMRPPSGDLKYLDRLSRAIYSGMAKSDSEAVWVLQTWIFLNQRDFWSQDRIEAFLDAVPQDRMLCLDLSCENRPQWSRTNAFSGKPWLWCNIQDWGRTVFLGGALDNMVSGLPAARRDPKSRNLSGLGFVNEGLGYNPVAYDLLFELAWRGEAVDLAAWLTDYAHHRYGSDNASAAGAWQILKDTVYNGPNATRSTVDQMPTLRSARKHIAYDNRALADAWRQLLTASNELGDRDTYQFDLVNIGRQVLVNHAAVLHQDVIGAYRAKDLEAFGKATDRFLQLFRDVDELLATRQDFLLGCWLEDAKRWGKTDTERSRLEWNARRVLTLWGETTAIDDYARKDWAGMVGGYYLHRWQTHLNAANESLKQGQPFDAKTANINLRKWMAQWSDRREQYSAKPVGDSVEVAQRLWQKYAESIKTDSLDQSIGQPDSLSLTTGKPATCSHALPTHTARLANDGRTYNTDQYWATDSGQQAGPAWWQADLEKQTNVGRVVVVGYYGDERHYGFTVETSRDGKVWQQIADRRNDTKISTAEGVTCRFKSRPVRYIRVTQTHNSANTGRHLVEVMAYEK